MSMIRLQHQTPSVYTEESRDFQLLSRLYDCVINGIQFDVSTMTSILDTKTCRDIMLPLLQTKLGFFSKKEIDNYSLRYVLQTFPDLVKNKGSLKAIKDTIATYLKIINSRSEITIYYVKNGMDLDNGYHVPDNIVLVGINTGFQDMLLLEEIFKYILPVGIGYYFYFYSTLSYQDKLKLQDNAELLYVSHNINDSLRESGLLYSETSDELITTFDFETDPEQSGWLFVDADGDSHTWEWKYDDSGFIPYHGKGLIISRSYYFPEALYPDNWAISPAIQLPNSHCELSIYVKGQDPDYPFEKFDIWVGTSQNISDMERVSNPLLIASQSYVRYTVDLAAYADKTIYVAIRHHESADYFALDVDYIQIYKLLPEDRLVGAVDTITLITEEEANEDSYKYFLGVHESESDFSTYITSLSVTPTNNKSIIIFNNDEYAYLNNSWYKLNYIGGVDSFPGSPSTYDVVYLSTGTSGLYMYNGSTWVNGTDCPMLYLLKKLIGDE